MEQNQRAIDTLARYIIYGTAAAAIGALCWFFRDVIVYILIAGVLSLIGQPLMKLLKKIRIRNRSLPDWLCAALSIVLILLVFFSIVILIFPVVASVFKDISMVDVSNTVKSISVPLQNFNDL